MTREEGGKFQGFPINFKTPSHPCLFLKIISILAA